MNKNASRIHKLFSQSVMSLKCNAIWTHWTKAQTWFYWRSVSSMQGLLWEKVAAGQDGHVEQWKGGLSTLDRVQTKAPPNLLYPSSALSALSFLLLCFQLAVTHWCPKSLHGCWARCWEVSRILLGFLTGLVWIHTDFMDL